MTLEEYSKKSAEKLVNCLSEEAANAALREIESDIEDLTAADEKWFWKEVSERYREAGKPFFKEAISGQKLKQLQAAVQQYLQTKSAS